MSTCGICLEDFNPALSTLQFFGHQDCLDREAVPALALEIGAIQDEVSHLEGVIHALEWDKNGEDEDTFYEPSKREE